MARLPPTSASARRTLRRARRQRDRPPPAPGEHGGPPAPALAAAGLGVGTAVLIVAQAALLAHVISGGGDARRLRLRTCAQSLIALAAVLRSRAAGRERLSSSPDGWRPHACLAELRGRLARQLLLRRPGRAPGRAHRRAGRGGGPGRRRARGVLRRLPAGAVLAVTVPVAVLIWVVPLDPIAAGIFAVTIPLLIVFMILIGFGAQSRTQRRWQALSLLSSHFLDVVRGLETLRAHRREGAQAQTLAAVGERYRAETMGTLRLAFLSALVLELCAMLGTGAGGRHDRRAADRRHLELDAGLTVLLLAPELYGPLRRSASSFTPAPTAWPPPAACSTCSTSRAC